MCDQDKISVILLEQHFVHSSPRNPTVFVFVRMDVGLVKVVDVGLVGLDIGFMIGFNVQVLGI